MKKRLVFDCDNVLLDYDRTFILWCGQYKQWNIKGLPEPNFMQSFENVTNVDIENAIIEFNNSEYFSELSPLPNFQLINELISSNQFNVSVVSYPGATNNIVVNRMKNIQRYYYDINDIYVLPLYSRKKAILELWQDENCIFVDDLASNCKDAKELGYTTIQYITRKNEPIDNDSIIVYDTMTLFEILKG